VVSTLASINEVNLRPARLVLKCCLFIYTQKTRFTHSALLCVNIRNNALADKIKMHTLCNEIFLKFEQEFQIQQVVGGQCLLADNGLHCLHVFADSVACILHSDRTTSFIFNQHDRCQRHIASISVTVS